MRRTTLLLPELLHERLREEALRLRVSVAELIRSRLESATKPKKRAKSRLDPLLRVAGLCDGPPITAAIDEKLYKV